MTSKPSAGDIKKYNNLLITNPFFIKEIHPKVPCKENKFKAKH